MHSNMFTIGFLIHIHKFSVFWDEFYQTLPLLALILFQMVLFLILLCFCLNLILFSTFFLLVWPRPFASCPYFLSLTQMDFQHVSILIDNTLWQSSSLVIFYFCLLIVDIVNKLAGSMIIWCRNLHLWSSEDIGSYLYVNILF